MPRSRKQKGYLGEFKLAFQILTGTVLILLTLGSSWIIGYAQRALGPTCSEKMEIVISVEGEPGTPAYKVTTKIVVERCKESR